MKIGKTHRDRIKELLCYKLLLEGLNGEMMEDIASSASKGSVSQMMAI